MSTQQTTEQTTQQTNANNTTTTDFESAARAAGVNLNLQTTGYGKYEAVTQAGDILYVSGSIARGSDGQSIAYVGKLGDKIDIATGQLSAKGACEFVLAAVHQHLGSLNKVRRIVRLTGYVSSSEDFTDQSLVVNGASDLVLDVFGEAGRHSRSAVGVAELPFGASVEVEAIIQATSD